MYKQQKTAIALGVIAALGAAFSASAQQNRTTDPHHVKVRRLIEEPHLNTC